MTAVVLGITFAPKGLVKLFDKISPEKLGKMSAKITNWGKNFNNNNVVKNLQGKWHNALTKSPQWLKTTGKYGLTAVPLLLGLGILVHWFRGASKRNMAFQNNVQAIRNEQARILADRMNNKNGDSYYIKEEMSYKTPENVK